MGLIQVRTAHRQIPGINLIIYSHRPAAGFEAPVGFVQLFDHNRLVTTTGPQHEQVFGEVSYHVTARYPVRHAQTLPCRIRTLDNNLKLEIVGGGITAANLVSNHKLVPA